MPSELLKKLHWRALQQCPQRLQARKTYPFLIQPISTSSTTRQDTQQTTSQSSPEPPLVPSSTPPSENLTPKQHALLTALDPNTASERREERKLMRQGRPPIGSRRRRAAVRTSSSIPFEQLPYQCFQEARKVLLEDRNQKLKEIEGQRARIERIKLQDVGRSRSALLLKERRLLGMMARLEKLKILADINDPLVKKRFEDGEGDMSRPVYRHLAQQKFLSRRYLLLKQRLSQMHVYPDILPPFDPSHDVGVSFGRKEIEPGAFVHSAMSERPPKLMIQPFDKGMRYVTVVVLDPDVPNTETNGFDRRCHFMCANVPISPSETTVSLIRMMGSIEMAKKDEGEGEGEASNVYETKDQRTSVTKDSRELGDVIHPWLAPHAQKGSPYHRICIIVLQQYRRVDVADLKKSPAFGGSRDAVSIPALQSKFHFKPVGGFLFRTQWDSGMDSLMQRMGVDGTGEELKRERVEPQPYKWKPSMSERYR